MVARSCLDVIDAVLIRRCTSLAGLHHDRCVIGWDTRVGEQTQMDPVQLATMAVTLIAPYLTEAGKAAAAKAGEAAGQQVDAILSAIRRRFVSDGDTYAQQTLERLEQQPEAEGRKRALADVVAEKAADPSFAKELAELLQKAADEPATARFVTNVYGHGKVGQLFNIGSVETLNVGANDPT
jgi:hypothetical protein